MKNTEKMANYDTFFHNLKYRKLLKKYRLYDINIKRNTIEKMNQKLEEKHVKK